MRPLLDEDIRAIEAEGVSEGRHTITLLERSRPTPETSRKYTTSTVPCASSVEYSKKWTTKMVQWLHNASMLSIALACKVERNGNYLRQICVGGKLLFQVVYV